MARQAGLQQWGWMGADSKGAERQWAPLCRKLHRHECWEGPGLLCSPLWPQCMVCKRHSGMIRGCNPLITEGDRGSWESWDMRLRTVRGVCGPLTRKQGPPSVWEVGSHGPTLARARVTRTGVGRREEVGEAERLLLRCTASAGPARCWHGMQANARRVVLGKIYDRPGIRGGRKRDDSVYISVEKNDVLTD